MCTLRVHVLLTLWQVKRDTEFLHKEPLWKALRICEEHARQKNRSRRESSLKHLHGLRFSQEARKAIDPAILARIRCGLAICMIICMPADAFALSLGLCGI